MGGVRGQVCGSVWQSVAVCGSRPELVAWRRAGAELRVVAQAGDVRRAGAGDAGQEARGLAQLALPLVVRQQLERLALRLRHALAQHTLHNCVLPSLDYGDYSKILQRTISENNQKYM